MVRKEFRVKRRDGTQAKFIFVKPKGSVWYWGVPMETKGERASLPLPHVNLDRAKKLKDCLDLIAKRRGDDWVGQVVGDLLKCKRPLDTSKK